MAESELSPLERLRAEAIAACSREENLRKLVKYVVPEKRTRVYGVYPTGVGYAGALTAYLCVRGRDVLIDTYFLSDEFNMYDVMGKRVLVVHESATQPGIPAIGKAAARAALSGYMDADDFRLLVVDTFAMLRIEDIVPTFREYYTGQLELDFNGVHEDKDGAK